MTFKNAIFLLIMCFTFLISHSQTTWEIEREKEHGVLRIKVKGLTLDDHYYFIYKNPQTNLIDTLRNKEAHLDLGNIEPGYTYNMGKVLKAFPEKLYGPKSQFIYYDWYYVSFPIIGLSEAQVIVSKRESNEKMSIHFAFEAKDTADYVFQLNFRKGDYFIEAPLLKQYALFRPYYKEHISNPIPSEYSHIPCNAIKGLRAIPSQTSNPNLSIVNIENLSGFSCYLFHDKIRYTCSVPSESSVHYIEHPYYKKIKYRSPVAHIPAPAYMKANSNDYSQSAYCVENTYVKPLFLFRPADYDAPLNRSNIRVNRRPINVGNDTSFLRLESYIESILFSKNNPCNQSYYSVSKVQFPFNADSIVCVEIIETQSKLPTEDSLALSQYVIALNKAVAKAKKPSKNIFKRLKRKNKVVDTLFKSKAEEKSFLMPNYRVKIPKQCDELLFNHHSRNNLHNGYFSWEPVEPCYDLKNPKGIAQKFFVFTVNPYTLKPYEPEVLFGPNFRKVVYEEIIKEYNRFKASKQKAAYTFNKHYYKPELKRHIMWGIDQKNVIIYYGNEGAFSAKKKLRIPYEKFK